MRSRELKALAIRVALSLTPMVMIGACGCSGPPLPATPVGAAEVHCSVCGKLFARELTQAVITPDGIDVYYCDKCRRKPGRRKS